MKTVQERLRHFINIYYNGKIVDFAKRAGKRSQQISNILNGKDGIGNNLAVQLEKTTGINSRWLRTGEGNMYSNNSIGDSLRPETHTANIDELPIPDKIIPKITERNFIANVDLKFIKKNQPLKIENEYITNSEHHVLCYVEELDAFIKAGLIREELPKIWNDKDFEEFIEFYWDSATGYFANATELIQKFKIYKGME
jgi:hypothetical protein